jgi:hypothetical protein
MTCNRAVPDPASRGLPHPRIVSYQRVEPLTLAVSRHDPARQGLPRLHGAAMGGPDEPGHHVGRVTWVNAYACWYQPLRVH